MVCSAKILAVLMLRQHIASYVYNAGEKVGKISTFSANLSVSDVPIR